jgi:acyl-coenzyme A thioesterase PaaI-like protein
VTSLIANPDWIAAARKCVQDAPFPDLVGIELTALDFDSCRLELTLGERHMQPFGIVHGGVLVAHGASTLMAMSGTGLQLGVPKFLAV